MQREDFRDMPIGDPELLEKNLLKRGKQMEAALAEDGVDHLRVDSIAKLQQRLKSMQQDKSHPALRR